MAKKKIVVDQEQGKVYLNGTAVRDRVDYDAIEDYYLNVLEYFANGKTNGTSHLSNIMQKTFKSAETNIDKSSTMALQTAKLYNELLKDTQNYFDSKKAVDADFSKYLLRDSLFSYQREVYDSPMKKKALCWGRRVGKSVLAARLAIKHCLEKEKKVRECIIIGLTLEKCAALYWEELKKQIQSAHVAVAKFDKSSYTITFSNGNRIILWGNNSKADIEKLRGKDSSMFIIEEMQSMKNLYNLLSNVIEPMIRARDGEIVCVGTGPLSAGTKWEEIINDPTWFHSQADMSMNTSIPNHEEILEQVLRDNHWTRDNPTFQREYLGIPCFDNNLLIYPTVHYYTELPKDFHPENIYIGVDLGWRDRSAVITMCVDAYGQAFVTEEWSKANVDGTTILNEIVGQAEKVIEEWDVSNDQIHIVSDTNEQNLTQDWYNRQLSKYICENAIKYELKTSYALLNEALSSGMLKITEEGEVDWDHRKTVYKTDTESGKIIYEEDKKVWHEDATAALRYAWGNYQSAMAKEN